MPNRPRDDKPPSASPLPLTDLLQAYRRDRDCSSATLEQYGYAVAAFSRFLGRPASTGDLVDGCVNDWLTWSLEHRRRPTVKSQRGSLLTLWRYACDLGLVEQLPRRIKRVRLAESNPEAWTLAEARALAAAAAGMAGAFPCGVRRSLLLRAFVLAGWYSGLRPCDLLALRADQVRPDGGLLVVQQKTGELVECRLPEECLAAIAATFPPQRERVFPLTRKAVWYWWQKLQAAAGISKGSPKWLRRSGATAVEAEHPGAAMAFLGHRTPGLAYKHYVDRRQVQRAKPAPPKIA